jgi:TolB-like protein
MKNYLLIALFLLTTISLATAQENTESINPSIAVAPFSYDKTVSSKYAKQLTQKIQDVLINQKRITVLEDDMFPKVFTMLNKQRDEIYLSSTKLAEQGKLIGASYMFVGKIISVGDQGFEFNLKMVDVSTARSISSKTYKSINNWTSQIVGSQRGNTRNERTIDWVPILEDLSGKVEKDVARYIKSSFPITYKIVRASKTGDKGIEQLMIEGGESQGLKNKSNLNVIYETMIDAEGKILRRKEVVGQVRVSSVEGEVSIVDLRSGEERIKTLLADKNNKIYLSSSRR